QGYDSSGMVKKVTKHECRVFDADKTVDELEKVYHIALAGRPGPCWIDIPMNIQAAMIATEKAQSKNFVEEKTRSASQKEIESVAVEIKKCSRPVLWLGNGIRLSGGVEQIEQLLSVAKIPTLVSWAGIDMIDSYHPLVFGRAGVYGQRAANFILQNSDLVISIGNRMAIPQVGYDISEFARAAKIVQVDIDPEELKKYPQRINFPICSDAKLFLEKLISELKKEKQTEKTEWISRCNQYKKDFPTVNRNDHPDTNGFINSYYFMQKLNGHLKDDQIIVTDMGTALLSGHQVLNIKKGQRLMTSTGLGEMGYGIPAAMGASFAKNKAEVLCLNCDGGMMMNLQELQTIAHHELPIKIIVFNNDGYLMIKHTQKSLFNGKYSGTDKKSGVSCPDFSKIATAFDMPSFQIRTWEDADKVLPEFQKLKRSAICEVFMDPEQFFYPKLALAQQKDGTLISPPLEDLSPFLSREEMKKNMIIGLHPKSEMIGK
ncbi:MAG TPA: thiamine pyrophosphate-binding protein, partial [Bacteroidia bacterium]